jgi:PST family polysaccharide transporter
MPAALVGAINMVPGWLCVSLGRAGVQFRWAVWSAPFVVAGFAVGLLWGAEGVAASFSCTFTVAMIVFVMMAAKGSPVSAADIFRAIARAFFAAFIACAGVFALRALVDFAGVHLVLRLAIFGAAYSILYVAAFCAMPGGVQQIRAALDLRNSLRTAKA